MHFSVNVLFYGDHFPLAVRCLDSIITSAKWDLIADLRLGLNAVCPNTEHYVRATAAGLPVPAYIYKSERNVGKYPLMRRMFYDTIHPLKADRIMWFDDDSCLDNVPQRWWASVAELSVANTIIGRTYRIRIRGNQAVGIRVQPWYDGSNAHSIVPDHYMLFVTGGWWILTADFAKKWDYPFPELHHNGGDSILGELCRQQGRPLKNFYDGVAINSYPRRGIETSWIWQNYDPQATENLDLSHQMFDCEVTRSGKQRSPERISLPGFC